MIEPPARLGSETGCAAAVPRRDDLMEHRFGRRVACGTVVRVCTAEGLVGEGRLRDVSLSGAYLQTPMGLPLYGRIVVSRLDPARAPVEMHASVVRRGTDGVGVEWCDTPTCSICHLFGCSQPCDVEAPPR